MTTGHYHEGGGVPHDHAFGRGGWFWEGLSDGMSGLGKIVLVLLLIATAFIAIHIVPAMMSRGNPPVSCQIFGGSWSPWNGWQCQ